MAFFNTKRAAMSIYGVTGVRLGDRNVVQWVSLCQVDPADPSWIGRPSEIPAHTAASMILAGDQLVSIFIVKDHGGTVHGADFKYVSDEHGRESIELEYESEGRRLVDLILRDD